ncbi:MAG: hypothetical protein JOZ25_05045, partial [Actinobacteria bacterium]|nr:hypothetical protein [Actinomycetota bacterium]
GIGLVLLSVVAVTLKKKDYATTSPQQRDRAIAWEGRYEDDVRVARFIDAHSTRADGLFAFPSRADLYFLADRFPATPYLWEHTPLVRASTAAAIRARLASPARPKFVVVIEGARDTDPSGRLPRVIDRDYRTVWRPPGVHHMRVMLVRGAAL